MQNFINGICQFVLDMVTAFGGYYLNVQGDGTIANTNYQRYLTWLNSAIIDGTLISSPLTWREFLLYIIPLVLIILAVYLFIKLAFKLLSLFSLR